MELTASDGEGPNLMNLLINILLFLCDGGCCVVELRLLLRERKANSSHGEFPCGYNFLRLSLSIIAVSNSLAGPETSV